MTVLLGDKKRMWGRIKKDRILYNILSLISKEPLSISEISRRLNINRSTLRYYLGELSKESQIIYERRNDLAGRPTMIKINKKFFDKKKKQMLKEGEEYRKEMENSPLKDKIIKLLKKYKELSAEEIADKLKDENPKLNALSESFEILSYLELEEKIRHVYKLK